MCRGESLKNPDDSIYEQHGGVVSKGKRIPGREVLGQTALETARLADWRKAHIWTIAREAVLEKIRGEKMYTGFGPYLVFAEHSISHPTKYTRVHKYRTMVEGRSTRRSYRDEPRLTELYSWPEDWEKRPEIAIVNPRVYAIDHTERVLYLDSDGQCRLQIARYIGQMSNPGSDHGATLSHYHYDTYEDGSPECEAWLDQLVRDTTLD